MRTFTPCCRDRCSQCDVFIRRQFPVLSKYVVKRDIDEKI